MGSKWLFVGLIVCVLLHEGYAAFGVGDSPNFGPLVTKESRRTLASSESGMITAVDVHDGRRGPYHLQFITMESSSLFLPVLLHTDMVFYVRTGSGTVSWVNEDDKHGKHSKDGINHLDVERGDIYRIEEGSVFYVKSRLDQTGEKLRIHAIFNTVNLGNGLEEFVGAYSNVSDLVHGFDDKVIQMGFNVSSEVVQAIRSAEIPPQIVHFAPNKTESPNSNELLEVLVGGRNPFGLVDKKKTRTRAFNVFRETPDVENCNGWSITVTRKGLLALKGSDIAAFMVYLTKGSMMAPHWNPNALEIAVVVHGRGMVQLVCPSNPSGEQSTDPFKCKNLSFRVTEGDVFIVPRFHPMAQMSFNNDSLVFIGFSTTASKNHPQFLAGRWSVLQTIDREILSVSFGTSITTIEKLLSPQGQSVMLECNSCAEEVEQKMEEEIARKEEEEKAKKREEEEARRRKEEEEAKKREEAAKKREEEEAKKREEEAKKEEEEVRKREEAARKREEEEARKREEEAKKREEEARKREEEEAARKREEEEAKKKEEEEEARKREEEARKGEEEARKREEEEEARKREEEQAAREEEARREEARKREEEQAKRQEEEARRKEEEAGVRKAAEAEAIRKWEEEARKREEEEAKSREGGEGEGEEKEREVKEGQEGEHEILAGNVLLNKMWRV